MAGLYQRAVNPAVMQAVKMAASQGAGGAVPHGAMMQPEQGSNAPVDVSKLGGLLGQAVKDIRDQNGNGQGNMIPQSTAVPALAQNMGQQSQAGGLGMLLPGGNLGSGQNAEGGGGLMGLIPNLNMFGGGMGGFGGGSV